MISKKRAIIDRFLEKKNLKIIESFGRQDMIYYVVTLDTNIANKPTQLYDEKYDIFIGRKAVIGRFRTLYQIEDYFKIK